MKGGEEDSVPAGWALPKRLHDLPIDALVELSVRARNALLKARLSTVGEVLELGRERVFLLQGIGPQSLEVIDAVLAHLADAPPSVAPPGTTRSEDPPPRSELVREAPSGESEPAVAPAPRLPRPRLLELSVGDPPDLLDLMVPLVMRVAELRDEPRIGTILTRYYGLETGETVTLQEIGSSFGVTRERIRQLKERGVEVLASLLDDGVLPYRGEGRLRGSIRREIDRVRRELSAPGVRSEGELLGILLERYGRAPRSTDPNRLRFLLDLFGIERVRPAALTLRTHPARWLVVGRTTEVEEWRAAVDALRAVAGELLEWVPLSALAERVNEGRRRPLAPELLASVLAFLPRIECREEEGSLACRVAFPHLSFSDQSYRILGEHGEAMHFRQICDELNRRSRTDAPQITNPRYLSSRLSGDPRFEPIGRSGRWALTEWGIPTGTVKELMRDELVRLDRPATVEELHTAVREARPEIPRSTVYAFAHHYVEEFARHRDGRLGLTEWGTHPLPRPRHPRTSHEEVTRRFRAALARVAPHLGTECTLAEAAELISEESGVKRMTVRRRLSDAPWSSEIRDRDQIHIAIRSDELQEWLAAEGSARIEERSMASRILEEAREILSDAPGGRLPLRVLRDRLMERLDAQAPYIYQVVEEADAIVKFEQGGVTHCLLRWLDS